MAAMAVFLIVNPAGDSTTRAIDDAMTMVAALAAAAGCLIASGHGGPLWRFWRLLGAACLLWGFGEAAWGTYEVLLGLEVPTPSVADVGYLGAIPLAAAAVLTHPAMSSGQGPRRTRFVLDGLIVASAFFFLAWALVLETIVDNAGSALETAVTLAYPLGDAVILSLILMALGHAPSAGRPPLYLVLAGLMALSLADAGFAYLTEVRGYETGHLIDLGWIGGYVLLMLGGVRSIGEPAAEPDALAVPSTLRVFVPFIPVIAGLTIGGYRLLTGPERDPILWSSALLCLGLVMIRQFVVLAENLALVHGLEAKVRQRTRELSDREARFHSLVQHSSDLIVVLDPAGCMRYVSGSIESILGWSPEEVTGRPLSDLVHPDDEPKVGNAIRGISTDPRGTVVVDWRGKRRDGSWSELEGLLTNHLGEEAVRGLVLNNRDVTQRRQLERSLRVSEERLAAQVEELQALDRIKDEFVATASHELRTPLTSILGQLEILADGDFGDLTPEETKSVAIMERNGRRLLGLIEDLLTLARIDSSGVQLRPARVDLRTMMDEVENALPGPTDARPTVVGFRIAPGLGSAVVDHAQLERALLNLLTNAVKFTPAGGSVTCTVERDEQDNIVFTVTDTGIGIPKQEQDRLFTRFFRSSLATSRAIQGSGLGLVIAKTIVEAHGGTLHLKSAEGEGTVVTVSIPAGTEPARRATAASARKAPAPPTDTQQPTRDRKVASEPLSPAA
jgi:PAS domain S-box-containing protein